MFLETIFYFLYQIIKSLSELVRGEGSLAFWRVDAFVPILMWYKIFAGVAIVLLLGAVIYVSYRMIMLGNEIEKKEFDARNRVTIAPNLSSGAQRWARITEKLNSENEADWKVAILEADAILEDIVGTMDVTGASMGDKLKNIEKSDFLTLESAWEAHKARNRIAHDEVGVPLSRREATRVLLLYEQVFREFKYL